MKQRRPNTVLEKRYKKQGGCCYYCHSKVQFIHITRDHILPKKDGHTLPGNSVFACRRCNSNKGSKTLEEFRDLYLTQACLILKKVVHAGFKISESQLFRFRYYHRVIMTVTELIKKRKYDKTL